ncbi:MAG: hypothetical protein ACI8SJ_001612 [Shewanella sp.]|jgi:hypothetical protein
MISVNRCTLFTITLLCVSSVGAAQAEQYVFPEKGQTAEQQKADEASCDTWAVTESGYNPSQPQTATAPAATPTPEQGAERGSGIRGAVSGAATGAVVAEIGDDDRSDAAASGAAVGAVAGRRQSRRQNANEADQQAATQQQAQAEVQTSNTQGAEEFNRARAACLEGKGYSVK